MKTADSFYNDRPEPNKSCYLALRQVVLQSNTAITETVKYGMPCFCLNDKPFCYLWEDKHTHHPYILMVDGLKLKHPLLEQGSRKRMKTFTVHPEEDLPLETINEILQEGLAIRS